MPCRSTLSDDCRTETALTSLSSKPSSLMDTVQALRDFFDRHLEVSDPARRHLDVGEDVSRRHLIHHLVERTIRRASVDAATQRALGPTGGAEVAWERCLMVAALTELRPLRLLARRQI